MFMKLPASMEQFGINLPSYLLKPAFSRVFSMLAVWWFFLKPAVIFISALDTSEFGLFTRKGFIKCSLSIYLAVHCFQYQLKLEQVRPIHG